MSSYFWTTRFFRCQLSRYTASRCRFPEVAWAATPNSRWNRSWVTVLRLFMAFAFPTFLVFQWKPATKSSLMFTISLWFLVVPEDTTGLTSGLTSGLSWASGSSQGLVNGSPCAQTCSLQMSLWFCPSFVRMLPRILGYLAGKKWQEFGLTVTASYIISLEMELTWTDIYIHRLRIYIYILYVFVYDLYIYIYNMNP